MRNVCRSLTVTLPWLIEAMQPDDCLVVMADHGNDPTIGHNHHTREVVPVLVYQQGMVATQLGVRTTLSDVGATVCEFFRAPPPQNGRSFLSSSGLQETPYEF